MAGTRVAHAEARARETADADMAAALKESIAAVRKRR
jgi:hypothetical protein